LVRTASKLTVIILAAWTSPLRVEDGRLAWPLNDTAQVSSHNVRVDAVTDNGGPAIEVRLAPPYRGPDTDTFALIPGLDFHNGTIEVDGAGSILPTALSGARGFIGIAFRIDAEGGSFAREGFYIRPSNGRAEDQLRRNHATQYFAYPGFDFDRLRGEAPGHSESYVDLVVGEWTHLRIEVVGAAARFYVGAAAPPVLIVQDLKRSAGAGHGRPLGRQRHGWPFPQAGHPPAVGPWSVRARLSSS
jgi:hypothetical protein